MFGLIVVDNQGGYSCIQYVRHVMNGCSCKQVGWTAVQYAWILQKKFPHFGGVRYTQRNCSVLYRRSSMPGLHRTMG